MSDTTRVPAELAQEVATIARDILAPIVGFTLTTRDDILARRGGADGIRIYQDLSRDGHAGSVLRKRRQAVIARPWTVEPASERPEDVRAAQLVRAALTRANFDRLCQALLSAVLTGYAVAEIMWESAELELESGERARFIVPAEFRPRNARRFRLDREMQLRLLTLANMLDGEAVPERKFVLARFWAEENEDPYGRGLGHDLFWPVFFKRNAVALWNALVERHGLPFIYAETPQGTPEGDRKEISKSIAEMARGGGLVAPAGTLIKFLEAGVGGSATGRIHGDLVEAMDAEISKIVLGETLTTQLPAGSGSRAASETHDGVRQELADQDADLLSGQLNATLLAWITEINMPGAQPPTVWRKAPEQPDLLALAKLDETLFKVGYEPTEELVKERYGEGYRKVEKPKPPPMVPPGQRPPPPGAEDDPEAEFAEGPEDAVTAIADRLARDAEGAQAELLDAVRAEVDAAADFADLELRLARLSGALPVRPIAEKLGPAFALAYLVGAKHVDDQAGGP
jgi:phage gp29-like protein